MRRIFSVLLLLLSLASIAQSQEESHQLAFGEAVSGLINANHLVQIYVFTTATETAIYYLSLSNTGDIPLQVTLSDSSGAVIQQFAEVAPSGETGTNILSIPENGATYYVNITPAGAVEGVSGGFDLIVTELTSGGRLVPDVLLTRGMTVTLEWTLPVRLSLEIRDPIGYELHWHTPNSLPNISITSPPPPIDCATVAPAPQRQTAQWEGEHVVIGSYEILVHYIDGCLDPNVTNPSIPFTVTVSVDGDELPPYTSVLPTTDVYVAGFVLNDDGSAESTGRSGFVRGQPTLMTPLTTAELFAAAQPILSNARLTAWIGNDQPYRTYVFEGLVGEMMTVRLYRLSGSLDAYLALIDESGNILALNDDYMENGTDAALENVRLPQSGRYLILATRYGEFAGATEGDFDLMVSRSEG